MDAKELDNIRISNLRYLLHEDTTLQRFYPLIPYAEQLTERLNRLEIEDKYQFLKRYEETGDELSDQTGVERSILNLTAGLLHLYDFKNRRLSEIRSIDAAFIRRLAEKHVSTSKEYLEYCVSGGTGRTAEAFDVCPDTAKKLFCYCDLMRLPGVKEIRAELYYDCGYRRLRDFAKQNGADMRNAIARYIQTTDSAKSVPLPKELSTQIAVAKALPQLPDRI